MLAEHPNDPVLLAHNARAEYLLGNHVDAALSAYAALSAAPHDELAMRIYALSLDGQGRGQEALWMAWRTVVEHPNEALAHRLYARVLQKARRPLDALVEVDEALRLGPNDVDTLVLRGSILHDMGRIPESTAAYEQALALEPANAEALNNLAVNRLRSGKFSHALRGFLGAAGSDPTLGNLVRRNIGAVLATMLRRVTVVAVMLGVLSAFVGSSHGADFRTVLLRVVTVMLVAGVDRQRCLAASSGTASNIDFRAARPCVCGRPHRPCGACDGCRGLCRRLRRARLDGSGGGARGRRRSADCPARTAVLTVRTDWLKRG